MAEDERGHYGDVDLEDPALQHIERTFAIDRILFLRQVIPPGTGGTMADLGDTNGIFLRSLGKDGISINVSGPAVRSLRGRGMQVLRADIEHLPFRDGSLGTVLLFETLEHLPNPIRVLNELARTCSGSLVVSIPSVSATRIRPAGYDPSRPQPQHHIFEFSPADFRTILTHTPFGVRAEAASVVLGGTGGILDRAIIRLWSRFRERDLFLGCFLRFSIYHLGRGERAEAGQ
jgi:SAM-dependent methyltransferase